MTKDNIDELLETYGDGGGSASHCKGYEEEENRTDDTCRCCKARYDCAALMEYLVEQETQAELKKDGENNDIRRI